MSDDAVGPVGLADGLGWASAALGVPLLLSPRRTLEAIGVEADGKARARAQAAGVGVGVGVGVREFLATGTILGMRHRRVGAWSRDGGFMDKFPIGSLMNRSLTVKTGQAHVHRYLRPLLARIENGEIDPSFVVSHHLPLEQAPQGYEMFKHKQDNCTKIVLTV